MRFFVLKALINGLTFYGCTSIKITTSDTREKNNITPEHLKYFSQFSEFM